MKKDRLLHIFAGLWSALVSAIIGACIKEFCDNNTDGNKWDWVDIAFTMIGALFIVLVILGMHYGKG